MEWLTQNWDNVLIIISSVISVASVLVKVTPTQNDDTLLAKIISVLDVLALNPKQPPK